MKILVTNLQLDRRTGTEIVVRDLDAGLRRRGHEVCVYTPRPGELAEEMRAAGATVVDDVGSVPFTPDVIHGHHNAEVATALVRFPTTPAVFVCHGREFPDDFPPRHPAVRRFAGVGRACEERLLLEAGTPAHLTSVVQNGVDLGRFRRRPPLPRRPRRALVFSSYAVAGGYVEQIRAACRLRGIDLDVVGFGAGTGLVEPEGVLGDYDLVFGKGRCALEALAVGCAVVIADFTGQGPMVTSAAVADLRDWNLGDRCMQGPVTAAGLVAEIDRYDPDDAARTSDWIRDVADLEKVIDLYERLYREAIAESELITTPPTWPALYRDLAAHAAGVERIARAAGSPLLGARVSPVAASQVGVQVLSAPALVAPGGIAVLRVEVRNGSREHLHSLGPTPVHLSYRTVDTARR